MNSRNSLLKVSGYVSLAFAILVLIDPNVIGSIPFFVNVYGVGRYLGGGKEIREGMMAMVVIMLIANGFLVVIGQIDAGMDVALWLFLGYAWYAAKPVVAKK